MILRIIIFLASPGDLADERAAVRSTIDELNHNWSEYTGVELYVIGWEDVPSGKGQEEAQEVINSWINDDYDIFLGLMGSRLGSPTRGFASGTVEEYERALELSRLNPTVRVKFYVKQVPGSMEREPTVTEFLERLKGDGVLYVPFASLEDLVHSLSRDLGSEMQNWSYRSVEVKEKDSDD